MKEPFINEIGNKLVNANNKSQVKIRQYNKLNSDPIFYFMTEENFAPDSSFFNKLIGLVETLIATGDSSESIEIIEALLEANPKHPELHKKKALALITENKYDEALKSLDLCIRNAPSTQKSQCLLYKADLLYSLQKYAESLKIYELLLQHNPNREQILYRKGLCILSTQKYKQATQIFDKVLSLNQNYSQCNIMNAHSLFMQKKYQKAIKCLAKVTQKNDFQNTDALYLKACCHYNVGQLENCEKVLKRIVEIDFGHVQSKVLISIVKCKIKEKMEVNRGKK